MSDVNANISVNIDTSAALAELKSLQRQISLFHSSIAKSSASASIAQRQLQQDFLNSVNATGQFAAQIRTIKTAAESFTTSLEKNKFSMREYFRYGIASSKSFGKLFRTEFDTINRVAEERVRKLQTQYIKLGRDASGAMKAISITPLSMNMNDYSTKTMMAAQRQQLFNQLLAQGTTNLINFGKNTQWAGRQLMVGFTVPLSIFGSTASKIFMDIEQQALRFKRVYGDLMTSKTETDTNLQMIRDLASEFTKYGVAIQDTMAIAADAAAAGFQGEKLQETVRQATKLSVLGEIDKQQAFQATITLQNAFKMSNNQLAESVDFLNAVENQTVVSLDDITQAIPRTAPIIRGLGGDVKDLAVFMAAMQEGGVDAASAANGLKSALGSLINPTKAAKEMLAGVGINLKEMTERNQGNIMRTVLELGNALKELTPLARQRVLEQLFGKFQYARVGALFDNIAKSGSQAQRVMELVGMSAQDLSRISQKELASIEENSMTKFKAAAEAMKNSIAPIGEVFIKVVTPILNAITGLADKFNGLSDHTKKVIAVIVTIFAGIGPVVLMLIGLFANFAGQFMKMLGMIRNGYLRLTGGSKILGEQTQFLTDEQIQAEAVAHSLDQVHAKLTQRFVVEADAVLNLKNAYLQAVAASERFAMSNPGMMLPQSRRGPRGYASGGIISGPGTGTSDSIIARVSNGEAIIPAGSVARNPDLVNALVANNIPKFATGVGTGNKTYWTADKRNALLDALGLTGNERVRIPLEATSARYSVAGAMAPASVNDTAIGMTQEFLQSMLGRASSLANVQVGLEQLGASSQRVSEILSVVGPELNTAIDSFDGSVQSWQTGTAQALERISHSIDLTEQELSTLRQRISPINPDDYLVGSNKVLEVGRRRAVPRDERVNAPTTYGTSRQLEILKQQFPNEDLTGWEYSHLPGYERIPAASAVMNAPTVSGKNLSQSQLDLIQQERQQYEEFRRARTRQAEDATNNIINTVRQTAGVESPSRRTIPIGEEIANGLIVGMNQRKDAVTQAATRLVDETVTQSGLIVPKSALGKTNPPPKSEPVFLGMPGMVARQSRFGAFRDSISSRYSAFQERNAARKENFRAFSQKTSGVAMGLSAATFAASFMPGPIGDMAQKIAPVVAGFQTLSMILPMLSNPFVALGAAVLALGVSIWAFNKSAQKAAKELADAAKKEAEARNGSARAILEYGKFIGDKALPSSTEFSRDNKRLITADEAKVRTFADFYSQKNSAATAAINAGAAQGKTGGVNAIAMDVANRAAIFGLGPKDIAANIKAAADLIGADEIQIKAAVQQLLAPNGKDILKEPLTIQARIDFLNAASMQSIKRVGTAIQDVSKIKIPKSSGIDVNYQQLKNAAGAQQSINKSFSGGFWSEALGVGKQLLRGLNFNIPLEIDSLKIYKDLQSKVQLASMQLDLAFQQQTQSLAILNQQYADGTIKQEDYNKQFDAIWNNFAGIGSSTVELIKALDKIDSSGELAKDSLADLATQVFSTLEKTNPKFAKRIKDDLAKLPKNTQISLMMGFAAGSLTMMDLVLIPKILEQISGKEYSVAIKIIQTSDLSKGAIAKMTQEQAEAELKKVQRALQSDTSNSNLRLTEAALKKTIAEAKKAQEEAAKVLQNPKETNGTKTTTDTTANARKSLFTDELMKKLKMFKLESINALGSYNDFVKALSKDMTGFKGMDNLLRGAGATQEAIDIINNIDSETLKTLGDRIYKLKDGKIIFGDLGKAILQFTKENSLMTFVDQQQQIVINTKEQATAFGKLQKAGLSATQILAVLENAALTANIAAEDINSNDFKQFIEGAKAGSEATKQLAKDLKAAKFAAQQEQETEADKVNQYFKYQEVIVKQKQRQNFIEKQGMTPEKYQKQIALQEDVVKAKQKEVDAINESINAKQEEIALWNRGLDLIGREEDKINEAYKKRTDAIDSQIEALNKVKDINSKLAEQEKQKTSLADALSQGDISAAAQIAQDMQAKAAENSTQASIDALQERKKQLEIQQQKEIEKIQVDINGVLYTRTQLQEMVRNKEDEIYTIQQTTLKKAQDLVKAEQDKLDKMNEVINTFNTDMQNAIDAIVDKQGRSKAEWDLITEAVNATNDYLDTMVIDLDDVASGVTSVEQAWNAVTAAINGAIAAQAAFKAGTGGSGGGGGGGGGGGSQNPGNIDAVNKTVNDASKKMIEEIKSGTTVTKTPSQIANEMATALLSDAKATAALGGTAGALSSARYTGQALQYAAQEAARLKAEADAKAKAEAQKAISQQAYLAYRTGERYMSSGGLVPKYFASGGLSRGTDTVPAMLTPGEFVMSRYAVNNFGLDRMRAINNGKSTGDSMYNYNLTVNAQSDASPEDIAQTVMAQLRRIDSQKLRGQRV
jgi:TP901 family phage tail tape measure protein